MHGFLRHSLAVGLAVCLLVVAPQALGVVEPQAGVSQQLAQSSLSVADLEEMEALLRELGFDPGPVDGVVDQDTLAAIARYQDFASLPGEPLPSQSLLTELRGVAAAFAALRNDQAAEAQTAAETEVDTTAPPPETAIEQPAPEASAPEPSVHGEPRSDEALAPQEPSEPEAPAATIAEKVIVPPPPVPPKLKPLEALPEAAPEPEPPQLAARPPEPAPEAPAAPPQPADPAARRQALVAAELAPYRKALANGTVTRDGLAMRFNKEGRQLLEAANYEAALLKFDVAIQLNPRFAGAYSNRGTAYELMEERERAEKDFERARQLGFGGVRPRAVENPLR